VLHLASNWEGTEVEVQVKFEPESVGEIRDCLRVRSAEGGEYSCPLIGHCVPPRPQGPILISPGSSGNVIFRNVFSETREFSFTTDNPAFTVSTASSNISSKQAYTLVVKYTPLSGEEENKRVIETGKLFVSCPALGDMPPWVFYLQGNV
jgi:hydrocephalus-inducing protein